MMDRDRAALEEVTGALARCLGDGVAALAESDLRAACAAACLAAYPDASGAELEMDLRRLLARLVEAYARDGGPAIRGIESMEAAYDTRRLQAAVRRLHAPAP